MNKITKKIAVKIKAKKEENRVIKEKQAIPTIKPIANNKRALPFFIGVKKILV